MATTLLTSHAYALHGEALVSTLHSLVPNVICLLLLLLSLGWLMQKRQEGKPWLWLPQVRWLSIFGLLLLFGFTTWHTWQSTQSIEEQAQAAIKRQLNTVLSTTHFALQQWVARRHSELHGLARDFHVRAQVQGLRETENAARLIYAREQQRLHDYFLGFRAAGERPNLYVIAPDGTNLYARQEGDLARQHPMAVHYPHLLARSLQGLAVLVPPLPAHKAAPGRPNIAGYSVPPAMFVTVPVYDEHGQVLALLAEELNPLGEFSAVLAHGRIGNSGETYAVSREGLMLSQSRFVDQLIQLKLLMPNQTSVLSIKLSDPGEQRTILPSYRTEQGDSAPSWTVMMQGLMQEDRGGNVEGYRDYRGIPVVGAWLWDERLQMGLVSEMDLSEAMATAETLESMLWVLWSSSLTILIAALWFLWRIVGQMQRDWALSQQRQQEQTVATDAAQRKQLARLFASVEHLPTPFYLSNPAGEIVLCNDEATNLFGIKPGDMSADTSLPLTNEAFESGVQEFFREGELPWANDKDDTRQLWFRSQGFEVVDGEQVEHYVLNLFFDVTRYSNDERAHALQQIEQERSLLYLQSLLDASGFSIIATDTEGTIKIFNKAAERLLMYSAMEMVGKNTPAVFHDANEMKVRRQLLEQELNRRLTSDFEVFVAKASIGFIDEQEWTYIRKDGVRVPVILSVTAVRDAANNITGFLSVSKDISDIKEMQQAMVEAKEEAEIANLAKSEFLASMSHEIRTPMNGVLGMLGLVLQTPLDAGQQHKLEVAQQSAQSLLGIINDILDFSKVEAGKLELDSVPFSIHKLFDDSVKALVVRAEERGLGLFLDTTRVHVNYVVGDPARVRQVISNLLSNAIKFTAQGEVIVRVATRFYDDTHFQLTCSVQDTGIGIPEDKIEHLFESFTQVDASTTRQYGGTGLGLAICKKLVELMRGSISVESKAGEGSTFRFNVLLDNYGDDSPSDFKLDLNGKNFLVVDDHPINREILSEQLKLWGAEVWLAESVAQMQQRCEQAEKSDRPYDMVLLDQQMPEQDGFAAAAYLRSRAFWSKTPVLMLTSVSAQHDHEEMLELGISGSLTKPVSAQDLHQALCLMLAAQDQSDCLPVMGDLTAVGTANTSGDSGDGDNSWPAGARVLLVEDNQVNQMVAQGMINTLGLQCDLAADGNEAIYSLKSAPEDAPYTLVLMDCQMPELDGYEATEIIRRGGAGARYETVPIIALTAHAMQGDREKCLLAGMNDYLAKPIETKEVFDMLKKWLGAGPTDLELVDQAAQDPIDAVQAHGDSEPGHAQPERREPGPLVWDQNKALDRLAGDERLMKTIIDLFLEDSPKRIQAIQEALAVNDMQSCAASAHAIKGASGNIAANALHAAARELEHAARQGASEQLRALLGVLERRFDETRQRLSAWLPEETRQGSEALMDETQLMEQIGMLAEALQNGDYIDLDDVLRIKEAGFEGELGGAVQTLAQQLLSFEVDSAKHSITQIRRLLGASEH
ncbi:MAG: response regulator [Oleiphilaceae bacterium]|nr:response regulator [Oleiphilaceae bacterium]